MIRTVESDFSRTQIGIRFWDPVRDRHIDEGLVLDARLQGTLRLRRRAVRTIGGVYAIHDLPGLNDPERFESPLTTSPPGPFTYWFEVRDTRRRYLPMGFHLDLPRSSADVFTGLAAASPASPVGSGPSGVYLFSAPTRPMSGELGAIRGQLTTPTDERVSHAWLSVDLEGPSFGVVQLYAMSDEEGRFVVPFLYPAFEPGVLGSPPWPSRTAPGDQTWQATLRVFYAPDAVPTSPDTRVPDFAYVVTQPPAAIWDTPPGGSGSPVPQLTVPVGFRRPTVDQTQWQSTLAIQPGSPP